jgi:DNA repair photolyase
MEFITRKSLLYKTGVEYGDYTINHIEGCSHGCKYPCYAMMMAKRFGRIRGYYEWRTPKLVKNAFELLEKEIPHFKKKIKYVHLCFMSDPFMKGYPEISRFSLDIIKILNSNGIKVTTLTKSKYPYNILDYSLDNGNEFGITLVSNKQQYWKAYEPYTEKPFVRIRSLKRLHKSGAKTWISMEPYPTPNISEQRISELLERIAFVDKIIFGRLNYNVKSTSFKNHKDYYNDLASKVIEFCNRNGIHYHIKKGTMTQ